jgi:hypothetical protein
MAAGLLLAPLIAMQVTDEVAWDLADFLVAGALVGSVGLGYELALRKSRDRAYRAAAGLALATAFILAWANLAVGVIGSEDNPANLMIDAVLAVGIVGVVLARFRPRGMARALAATALAQVLVAVIALFSGWGFAGAATAFFSGLWLLSAWLFRKAARQQAAASSPTAQAPSARRP